MVLQKYGRAEVWTHYLLVDSRPKLDVSRPYGVWLRKYMLEQSGGLESYANYSHDAWEFYSRLHYKLWGSEKEVSEFKPDKNEYSASDERVYQ